MSRDVCPVAAYSQQTMGIRLTMEPNVCCGAVAGAGSRSRTSCQLYVGHEGQHAALVLKKSGRVLRRWRDSSSVDVTFTGTVAAGLPWAPGFPAATPTPAPTLTAVAAEPPAVEPPAPSTGGRHLYIA
jgi:hypothetical protein